MPSARSAGVVLFRRRAQLEVLLGHMGGPFWARKDAGAWTVPKGLIDEVADVDEFATVVREFEEELGHPVPPGVPLDLGVFEQSRHKQIHIWAIEGELDAASCVSNTFELEWPPKSGRFEEFPEIDRAGWFSITDALPKVITGQRAVLEHLGHLVSTEP